MAAVAWRRRGNHQSLILVSSDFSRMIVEGAVCVIPMGSLERHGFTKIVILNTHGGNNAFLDYFSMSQLDVPRDYVLYIVDSHRAMYRLASQDGSALTWLTKTRSIR